MKALFLPALLPLLSYTMLFDNEALYRINWTTFSPQSLFVWFLDPDTNVHHGKELFVADHLKKTWVLFFAINNLLFIPISVYHAMFQLAPHASLPSWDQLPSLSWVEPSSQNIPQQLVLQLNVIAGYMIMIVWFSLQWWQSNWTSGNEVLASC